MNEYVWADNEKYFGKILELDVGYESSMQFHAEQDKTWYVLFGSIELIYIDTDDAKVYNQTLTQNESWRAKPLQPYRFVSLEKAVLIEVGTPNNPADIFKIAPGKPLGKENGTDDL